MEILYKAANIDDLEEIYLLIKNAVKQMESENIYQWDDIYPSKNDLKNDIEKNQAYIGIINKKIAIIYTINRECDREYITNGKWKYNGESFVVIHRLCVSADFQNKGVGKNTLAHIERKLTKSGTKAIRLDVFVHNPYALKLYTNNGYYKVGTADWRKGRFLLMEKLL